MTNETENTNGQAQTGEERVEGAGEVPAPAPEAATATDPAATGEVSTRNFSEADPAGDAGVADSPSAGADGGAGQSGEPSRTDGAGPADPDQAPPTDAVVDAEMDAGELASLAPPEEETSALERNPGELPPGVDAADPQQAMPVLPELGSPEYTRWLEGLVSLYREHTAELRAIARRSGVATPDLPHYPEYKPSYAQD